MVYTKAHYSLPEVKVEKIAVAEIGKLPTDGIIVCVEEKNKKIKKTATLEKLDRELGGIFDIFEKSGFKGKNASVLTISTAGKMKAKFISFVGTSSDEKDKNEQLDVLREGIAKASCELRDRGCEKIALLDVQDEEVGAEAVFLGTYRFEKYKKSESKKAIKEVVFTKGKKKELEKIRKIAEAVNWVRDLQNEPGNVINPATLAQFASQLAEEHNLGCKIYEFNELVKLGMGGIVAVGKGSEIKPKLVHLWWKPGNAKDKVGVVGKAITFDSGGLSLKPPSAMVTMKYDKSGACVVLGVMKLVSELEIPIEVHGIFAPCENMPSGSAQRPDDIIRTYKGITVEVENTDAEGRLTLADALWYCAEQKVSKIVDFATLTGACVVALGEHTAGVMGNDKEFVNEICEVGNEKGERMWPLPFNRYLDQKLKSPFADVKNVGDRWGGALTAGLFLKRFVPDNVKWAHIDIAGPAYVSSSYSLWRVKGGSGFGVRTMISLLERWSSSSE